jgi:hypothetical protein
MRGRQELSSPGPVVGPDPILSPETGLPPILVVRWIDSGMAIDRGWARRARYIADVRIDRMIAHSAGYLMHEDEHVLVLSATYDPAGETFYGAPVITKASILERKELG